MTSQPSLQTAHRPARLWLALFLIGIGWGVMRTTDLGVWGLLTGIAAGAAVEDGRHVRGELDERRARAGRR